MPRLLFLVELMSKKMPGAIVNRLRIASTSIMRREIPTEWVPASGGSARRAGSEEPRWGQLKSPPHSAIVAQEGVLRYRRPTLSRLQEGNRFAQAGPSRALQQPPAHRIHSAQETPLLEFQGPRKPICSRIPPVGICNLIRPKVCLMTR